MKKNKVGGLPSRFTKKQSRWDTGHRRDKRMSRMRERPEYEREASVDPFWKSWLIFDKGTKWFNAFPAGSRHTWTPVCTGINVVSYLLPYTKTNLRWETDLHVKAKIIKTSGRKHRRISPQWGGKQRFLRRHRKQ